MKRFLKHNRYQMDDLDREKIWHGVRRDLRGNGRRSLFRTVNLRPALVATATVAALVVMGVWWVDSNQPGKIQDSHPGLLAEGPAEEPMGRAMRGKEPGTESMTVVEMEKGPRGTLAEDETEAIETFDIAVAPSTEEPAEPEAKKTPRGALDEARVMAAADMAVEKSHARAGAPMGVSLTGKVRDPDTGQGLAFARVLIRGTTRTVVADSSGVFHLANLTPGQDITLVISMLGYSQFEQVVAVPEEDSFEVAFNLEPMMVASLDPLENERDAYMVEVQESVAEMPMGTTTLGDKVESNSRILAQNAPAPSEETHKRAQPGREGTWGMGSVTGGTKPPNDEQVELMYFEHTGVNPFVAAEDDALSTFALDVDTASWTVARNYLSRGMLPPKDAIRVEEFVNAFDPGWERNTEETFQIHTDGSVSRFGDGYHLLRVGVVGKTVEDENRKAANLIFVIDISGSMNRENRLGAVKKSLHILLNELGEGDRVGLVVYGSQGEVRLEPTDASRREVIIQAIDGLISNGSTNVYEGLDLAYRLARKHYEPAKVNRLILCSDGVANNGASTEAEKILSLVRKASDEGITISTIGFGMGNYNDVMMEKLANKGDGNYYYVDGQEETERVFKENLTGMLQTIAREVKVQVEFDPRVIKRWRLLGYENRDVADRDFRNDAVDAGEVGAGHQVTALYEVKVIPQLRTEMGIKAGTVRLRYEAPAHDTARAGQVEEIEHPIVLDSLTGKFDQGMVWMRVQAVAAEFAEILRGSYWAKESRLIDLVPVADGLAADLPGDRQVRSLADMIRKAADLQSEGPVELDK